MIVDRNERSGLYADPRLAPGFRWIADNPDPQPGRYDLADGAYVNVADYETTPVEGKKFESHRRFIDIQLITTGAEGIDVAPLEGMSVATPYDETNDIVFYETAERSTAIAMAPGLFAVFYPDDAHRPGNQPPSGPTAVRKVVVKIPVERS